MLTVLRFRGGREVEDEDASQSPITIEALPEAVARVRDDVQRDDSVFMWVKLDNPTPAEAVALGDIFDFPELQRDDALNPRQRAKVETDGGRLFIVLKELRYVEATSQVETGQVAVFLTDAIAVTVRLGDAAPGSSRARLRRQPELALHGPSSVLYAVADSVVDGYIEIVAHLAEDLEQAEADVFSSDLEVGADTIYILKRENLEVKRAVGPLAMPAREMIGGAFGPLPEPLRPYFRDVGDHLLRVADSVETHDQLLMTMLMAANSQQDLQQNQDMRKISAWAAIIAVPTALAGVYGMNFENMPELHSEFGYPIVLGLMASVCLLLYWKLKRSKWL